MSPLRARLSERLGLFTVHRVSNYKCEQSLCSCLRNLACRLEWCALFFETEFFTNRPRHHVTRTWQEEQLSLFPV